MKKIFTLTLAALTAFGLQAQVCTTSGFDACSGNGVVSDFRNAVQISGTGAPLTIGAKYKFNNAIPSLGLDAVITIEDMVNATMTGAANANIDDDGVANETGTAGAHAALFAPRIAPDQVLSCSNRTGYVQFTIKFYTHYSGNAAPAGNAQIAVANLNFLHFDMDGSVVGNNGWFKEIGYAKVNGTDPVNYGSAGTELTGTGNVGGWMKTFGSTNERTEVSRCAEVIAKSVYSLPQTSISFRMGYDYKAPSTNCAAVSMQPTRQYGSKFGCFSLPAGAPLPVSLVNLAANYNSGITAISWTSLQEIDIESYEIQRSLDGVNFETAGNVKATNASNVQQYKFNDNVAAVNARYIYYRIRIVDKDQSMKLTNTVSVKTTDFKSNEMSVMPNPASGNAQIRIKAAKASAGEITVFDASGKTIQKQQANLSAGNNTIVINNITGLSEGYYTIRLVANDEVFTTKLLIWK
jgi:Secretion system C-terminal sorting domain